MQSNTGYENNVLRKINEEEYKNEQLPDWIKLKRRRNNVEIVITKKGSLEWQKPALLLYKISYNPETKKIVRSKYFRQRDIYSILKLVQELKKDIDETPGFKEELFGKK